MSSEVFQLYLLLTLKDYVSGGLNSVEARFRSGDKAAKQYLQTFQQLRDNMKRDLTVAGIGVGTLMMLRKGVTVAGDFEQAMADLRMSISKVGKDGSTDLQALGSDLARYETLGMGLGNRLPGTTQDFVKMFAVLKQGGLESNTILDGTGQAVAHLAVVTSTDPSALAEPFAQYAQQFHLTGEEATKLSDLLARLKFGTGLSPGELIEGSKFFQMRAGMALGLTGLTGAETSGRLLGTLRTYGLEGGIGGRELGGFMLGLTFKSKEQQKLLTELRTKKGIDLQFFDKSGEFLGVENVFKQMEKMRSLSTEERMSFGEKLFSRENVGIANAMMQAGTEGWKKINDRIDQVAPLQDLLNTKTETYNARLEAVQGTLSNITATGFTPLNQQIKPLLTDANTLLGYTQSFLQGHPQMVQIGVDFVAIGGAVLVVTGGVRALITAINLARIASALAAGESIANVSRVGLSVVSLRAGLAGLGTPVKIAIIATEVLWVLSEVRELKQLMDEIDAQNKDIDTTTKGGYQRLLEMKKTGTATPALYKLEAQTSLAMLNREGTLSRAMDRAPEGVTEPLRMYFNIPERGSLFEKSASALWSFATFGPAGRSAGLAPDFHPFYSSQTERESQFRKRAPALQQPEVMAEFVRAVQGLKGWSEEAKQGLLNLTKQSYPESYQKGVELYSQSMTGLSDQTQKTTDSLGKMDAPLTKLPTQFTNAGSAAQRFSDRLDGINLNAPTTVPGVFPGVATPATKGPLSNMLIPSKASGGRVLLGGLVSVHRDEEIVPARVTSRWQQLREREPRAEFRPEVARAIASENRSSAPASVQVTLHYSPKIQVSGGNAGVAPIEQVLASQSKEFVDYLENELARRFMRHRERS